MSLEQREEAILDLSSEERQRFYRNACSRRLTRCFRDQRNVICDDFSKIELAARVIDVDPGEVAFVVVVQDDPLGDFATLGRCERSM